MTFSTFVLCALSFLFCFNAFSTFGDSPSSTSPSGRGIVVSNSPTIPDGANVDDDEYFRIMGLGDYEIKDKRVLDGQCFYMPIERIFDQRAFIDITGRIEAGTIRAGAQLFLIGLDEDSEKNVGPQAPINIDKVKMFRKVVPKAYATDNVGLEVRGVDHDLLETGKVLAEAGCLEAQNEFKATVYLSLPAQGGRTSAIQVGHKAQFRFHQININGTIENISGASTGKPGEISTIRVKLDRNPALKQGLRFSMRMNGRHLGFGIVE